MLHYRAMFEARGRETEAKPGSASPAQSAREIETQGSVPSTPTRGGDQSTVPERESSLLVPRSTIVTSDPQLETPGHIQKLILPTLSSNSSRT
ncbi:hypothetical protein Moror_6983 [Moniliophthora roreri MCA 2997]|uniref:Uncharacterized protein n=1 Tax=Moniliophthora roreri (strain MCA 2997) TaxID=1381753 RepID=V2XV76_MONRO|nr:hypothetical protein Moror_6983 [Moniliophthora roreri MCA 2997]